MRLYSLAQWVAATSLTSLVLVACQSTSVNQQEQVQDGVGAGTPAAVSAGSQEQRFEECAALQKQARLLCRDRGRPRTQNTGVGGRSSPECMTARMEIQRKCVGG